VIAGHAEPHARIDVLSDGKTIASTQAGAIGDFVTVLDKPLAPGNYQLTLKATGKRGTKVSAEVATVSVPKDKAGDLLAMVSSPGQASRIITAPKPQGETVSAPASTQQRPNDEAGTQLASLPAAGSAGAAAASDKAALGPLSGRAEAVEKPGVHVDAVEVEGDKLYVAGAAKSGSTVRVYADDDLVGQATASKQGRFVVNGTRKLAIGGHTIRADLVDPATGKVTLRATVPFDRPEGAQFAAVSPQQAGSSAAAPAAAVDAGKNGGPQTIVQQPLAENDNMIIIRRGDTLWQIARRAYGYGIRYTTIYLANSDQIANPNLILPGQIFDMPQKPQKPIAQAWELHRELLSQGK
jgi:nucleoid-associated protein YgaU